MQRMCFHIKGFGNKASTLSPTRKYQILSRQVTVESQYLEHEKKVWNMFKVYN